MAVRAVAGRLNAVTRAVFPHFCAGCGEEGEVACNKCLPALIAPGKGLFACPGCGCDIGLGVFAGRMGVPPKALQVPSMTRSQFKVTDGRAGATHKSAEVPDLMRSLSLLEVAPAQPSNCGLATCAAASLDSLSCAVRYDGSALGGLLRLWKYERVQAAETIISTAFRRFLEQQCSDFLLKYDGATVVPVPLHFLRQVSRGFNQSESLARAFADVLSLRVDSNVLKRSFGGTSQASLEDKSRREENISEMFNVSRRVAAGAKFVLIDDVATTGATLRDCARALKRAGAGEVHAVTLLRK